MSTERQMDDSELHAWLDGELDAESALAVEAWLADHPEDAHRVDTWRVQAEAMKALYADVLEQPIPQRMTDILSAAPNAGATEAAPVRPRAMGRTWMQAAAALLLFVSGGASGWWLGESANKGVPPRDVVFVDQAVGTYKVFTRERRHPVEVWADKEEPHLVSWLSKRVGRKINPPPLDQAGFKLVGGRLVADNGGPAALFMYEDPARRRLTLYVRSARKEQNVAFRIAESRGVSAFYWIEKPFAYALVGKLKRQEMLKLGRIVYERLNAPAK